MHWVLKAVIGLSAIFLLFRTLPVGSRTVSHISVEPGTSLSEIVRPRFLVPREIKFSGWPLPGGGFSLISDPHSRWTVPLTVSPERAAPQASRMVIQAIDVNYAFDDVTLRENVIAVWFGGELYEFSLNNVDLVDVSAHDKLHYIGKDGERYFFLMTLLPLELLDGSEKFQNGVLAFKLSKEADGAKIVLESDRDQWTGLVQSIQNIPNLMDQRDSFCNSRSKNVSGFWKSDLLEGC